MRQEAIIKIQDGRRETEVYVILREVRPKDLIWKRHEARSENQNSRWKTEDRSLRHPEGGTNEGSHWEDARSQKRESKFKTEDRSLRHPEGGTAEKSHWEET